MCMHAATGEDAAALAGSVIGARWRQRQLPPNARDVNSEPPSDVFAAIAAYCVGGGAGAGAEGGELLGPIPRRGVLRRMIEVDLRVLSRLNTAMEPKEVRLESSAVAATRVPQEDAQGRRRAAAADRCLQLEQKKARVRHAFGTITCLAADSTRALEHARAV